LLAGDAAQTFDAAARWLARNGDVRFLLFVHTYEVHSPYRLRDAEARSVAARVAGHEVSPFAAPYLGRRLKAHNTGRRPLGEAALEGLRALYAAETQYLDRSLGRFFERLDAIGIGEDAIVVLTADHGEELGIRDVVGHGNSLHDHGVQVPLGFRWPGRLAPGWREEPVPLADVLPTLLDLAGLPVPDHLDGRSLAPKLRAPVTDEQPTYAISELHRSPDKCREDGARPCTPAAYAVHGRRFKLVANRPGGPDELFELESDPREIHDVAADHPQVVARLLAVLEEYLSSAAEPPVEPRPDREVPEETRKQLEALGYIGEDAVNTAP